jgi:hypothetical protein
MTLLIDIAIRGERPTEHSVGGIQIDDLIVNEVVGTFIRDGVGVHHEIDDASVCASRKRSPYGVHTGHDEARSEFM